jgi:hypothetical protein
MADNKTKVEIEAVEALIKNVEPQTKQDDCQQLVHLFEKASKLKAKVWGSNMIGFGAYHYKYDSGREGDWFVTGFSPRKQNIVIYIMDGFTPYLKQMENLGKFKTGKSCLYINRLENIDVKILEKIITKSVAAMNKKYNN